MADENSILPQKLYALVEWLSWRMLLNSKFSII